MLQINSLHYSSVKVYYQRHVLTDKIFTDTVKCQLLYQIFLMQILLLSDCILIIFYMLFL
jgi:hypothetical protein